MEMRSVDSAHRRYLIVKRAALNSITSYYPSNISEKTIMREFSLSMVLE